MNKSRPDGNLHKSVEYSRHQNWLKLLSVVGIIAILTSACGSATVSSNATTPAKSTAKSTTVSSVKICVPHETVGLVDILGSSEIDAYTDKMVETIGKDLGWTVNFVNANGSASAANEAIDAFVTEHVNVIMDVSAGSSEIESGLEDAKSAGIPVFALAAGDRPSSLFAAEYTENEYTMGKILADYIVKHVTNPEIANLGTNLLYAGVQRTDALENVVSNTNNRAHIVASQNVDLASDADTNTASALSAMLLAHPNINAVVAVFDDMAPPAIGVLKDQGLTNKVGLYTYYVLGDRQYLKDNELKAVANANLPATAVIAFDQWLAHVIKHKPIDPNAMAQSGLLHYQVVTEAMLQKGIGLETNSSTLAPYLKKWQTEYSCK